jgi:hypothetical protein
MNPNTKRHRKGATAFLVLKNMLSQGSINDL